MEVADNNRSETVVKVLHRARLIWGMPACLRTDRGGVNVLAADYLLQIRGSHNRSFIAGRSIHNQPIERQWKDTKAPRTTTGRVSVSFLISYGSNLLNSFISCITNY